ncbi:MAG: phosphatidylserine decarboxylase [Xanthomonadaceae bacterium]|nr:phosphatidylserine decarboxylase [Xanthomonadaceae bacterium]MDE1958071.1 phosphatidylserine decarboxylase [Xanthomonadaceae bacterium]MDE2177559.1 phosphatidylserine decarboxylase [Xanthomonadaceae bacterium]MDE2244694.1 phosphatidylserine decarboxylase [Xanthomonadaceae bacterium]
MRLAALQTLLPHRALSAIMRGATRWTWSPWKNLLIRQVVRRYGVDLGEAAAPAEPDAYAHFDAFFTRALRPGARPIDPDPAVVLCPADGRISQAGPIDAGRLLQAKGRDFTAAELLADDRAAAAYRDGAFVTVYLSPRDYHRVHMPLDGTLLETAHVPGRLFSVAPSAVAAIPRLFARNERLVCRFDGSGGPFAVVMVGALLVSGVETAWGGWQIPPYAHRIVRRDWRGRDVRLARGAEMARFHMGSTVILLLPAGRARLADQLTPGHPVRVGQGIGRLSETIFQTPERTSTM